MSEQRYATHGFAQRQVSYSDGLNYIGTEEDDASLGPLAIPIWQPEYDYAEPPLTEDSSAPLYSPEGELSWNPFDASFGNATSWQQWDEQQISTPSSHGRGSVDYGSTSFGHTSSPVNISNYTSLGMSNPYHPTSPSYPTGTQYSGQTSASYKNMATADFAFQPADSSIVAPKPKKSHQQEHKHSDKSASQKSGSTQPSMASSSSKLNTSKTGSSKRARQNRVSEHTSAEKQYRGRMNDEFATLLAALPKDVVASATGGMGLLNAQKPLSKIEVLDLAKKHIDAMEGEQTELEDEGQTLHAQVDFFKRIYVSCRGQLLP